MEEWRIRQQKRRNASGKHQARDSSAKSQNKVSGLDAVRNEYEKCRNIWRENLVPGGTVSNASSDSSGSPYKENVVAVNTSSTPSEDIKQEIMGIYKKYNPSKIGEVDALMEKYSGNEKTLLERIRKKYTVAPAIDFATGDLPGSRVFMDFEVDGSPAGRVHYRLYDSEVPLTVDNFRALCTGEKVRISEFANGM